MRILKDLLYGRTRKRELGASELAGLSASQELAYAGARAVAAELSAGWTEVQAARLLEVWLRDNGVSAFFHKPFAWFGERARFDGMSRWRDFLPSGRVLKPGDCVILDAAPIFKGYPADIGYPTSLGPHPGAAKAKEFLRELRGTILGLFSRGTFSGGEICETVARRIQIAGYDPVHHRYPGAVLGHRLHPAGSGWRPPTFIPFGWQAIAGILSEGVLPDLLNEEHKGELSGAWAIEPHLGGAGFGAKFEEVLVVDGSGARWLSPEPPWL